MFKREIGALIDQKDFVWDIAVGDQASLLYPDEKIWEMSKYTKKIILAHTHPPAFNSLSATDLATLRAWSFALPNRVEMHIICRVKFRIEVVQYKYKIEPLKSWIEKGKIGERKTELENNTPFLHKFWVRKLMQLSEMEI